MIINFAINTTVLGQAPVLSNASSLKTGSTTGRGSVTTSGTSGTLYMVVTTSATTPSIAQIKAGQDHTGSAAAASTTASISTSGIKNLSVSGLTASTVYYCHFVHTNASAQDSNTTSTSSFTTDATPSFVSGIGDTQILNTRNDIVDDFFTGDASIANENTEINGITDETGYTTAQYLTADALRTAINADASTTTKKIYELDWDGVSQLTASTFTGITAASCVANGSMDWGRDRPDAGIIIRPASGRSPIIQAPSGQIGGVAMKFEGFPRIHLDGDVTVQDGGLEFEGRAGFATAGYEMPQIVYIDGWTIKGATNDAAIDCGSVRMMSVKNVTAVGNFNFINRNPNYLKVENCVVKDNAAGDIISIRGYQAAYNWVNDWTSHIWISGLFTLGSQPTSSLVHQDGFQITQQGQHGPGSVSGTQDYLGTRAVVEYSFFNVDSGGSGGQVLFGDDPLSDPGFFQFDHVFHNNILIGGGKNGYVMYDPSDNGEKAFYRNHLFHGGGAPSDVLLYDGVTQHPQVGEVLSGGSFSATVATVDTSALRCTLTGISGVTANNAVLTGNLGANVTVNMPNNRPRILPGPGPRQTGTGYWKVTENLRPGTNNITNIGYNNTTVSNTVMPDEDLTTVITGNGTTGLDIVGDSNFTQCEQTVPVLGDGTYDEVASRAAWRTFCEPIAGWGTAGARDPDTWPTTAQQTLTIDS